MGRLLAALLATLPRLACTVLGHAFLPFPECHWAALRCHRCGYRVGW